MEEYTIIGVRFNKYSPTYHYKTNEEFEVKDLAVVKAPDGFKVVEVTHINVDEIENPSFSEYKWIVQKLVDQRPKEDECERPTRL